MFIAIAIIGRPVYHMMSWIGYDVDLNILYGDYIVIIILTGRHSIAMVDTNLIAFFTQRFV